METADEATCDNCGKVAADCDCAGTTTDTEGDSQEEFQFRTQRIHSNLTEGIESVIDAKFRIIGELGSGADSTVYLAEHLYLQKKVSLKLFKPIDFESNRYARIQIEAVTLASISHPNIVGVTDLGLMGSGIPYIVQEYIEGKDFLALIRERGPLSEKYAIPLFCQIASGVAYLHGQNIIHRDIKPSNIIISSTTSGDIAKLIDLGIAKPDNPGGALSFATTSGSIFGSPFYMSPEQCRGGSIDARSDIYSFGCVMYEALTGSPPFRGQTMLVTMDKHLSEVASPVNPKRRDIEPVSAELESIVLKCLAKRPEDRYQDMTAVHAALERLKEKPFRGKNLTIAQGGFVLIGSIVVLGFLGYLAKDLIQSGSQHGKEKTDQTRALEKVIDRYSYSIAAVSTSSLHEAQRGFQDVYDEAVKQKLPAITQLQAGTEVLYVAYSRADLADQKRIFGELQFALREVEKKLKKDPNAFQSKSIDCLARIYYYAGDFAMREEDYELAEKRFLVARKYAALCTERSVTPTVMPDMIKSSLAMVYHLTGRDELAETIAKELDKTLSTGKLANDKAALNNVMLMADIDVKKGRFEDAARNLRRALILSTQTGVRTHDRQMSKLLDKTRAALGDEKLEQLAGLKKAQRRTSR